MAGKQANYLKDEKSPYLMQHAYDLVNWYPWGDKVFVRAKNKNLPIFLVIGYSTCYHCHLMGRESFNDPEVAELLNKNFMCIQIDAEERPDLARLYAKVGLILTGAEEWPLIVIMTPDKKPFFAANYLPMEAEQPIAGMLGLLPYIKEIWTTRKQEVEEQAEGIYEAFRDSCAPLGASKIDASVYDSVFTLMQHGYDADLGGFHKPPKHHNTGYLLFLIHYARRFPKSEAKKMLETTLQAMSRGAIYDHIGMGFHHASQDAKWLHPQFEKMLCDQALMSIVYTQAYQLTGKDVYKKISKEILQYVMHDLKAAEGAFQTGEDSMGKEEEGDHCVWTLAEIEEFLDEEEKKIAIDIFGLTEEGNFSDVRANANVFYMPRQVHEWTGKLGMTPEKIEKVIAQIRRKLNLVRQQRNRPYKDEKILTDHNGLAISAFAQAARVFDNQDYRKAAKKATNFFFKTMYQEDDSLMHFFHKGELGIIGYLPDYAYLTMGLIDLYQATFDERYLILALRLDKYLRHSFWDEENNGFFFYSVKSEQLTFRFKDTYDSTVPSANAVCMYNLWRLGQMTGKEKLIKRAEELLASFSQNILESPLSHSYFVTFAQIMSQPCQQVVIVGDLEDLNTEMMMSALRRNLLPNVVVLFKSAKEPGDIVKVCPQIEPFRMLNNKTTAYVCSNFVCNHPTNSVREMMEMIGVKQDKE